MNMIKNSETRKRDTGIETLRVIAMLMIIAHHFSVHGGWSFEGLSFNSVLIDVLALGGKVGVDVFVLITGYYSLNSKFSIKKIIRLLLQVTFYSISLYALAVAFSAQPISLTNVAFAVFPVFGYGYWFFTTYFLLLCLMPFLNAGIKNISQKQHALIIGLLLVAWTILPSTLGQVGLYSTSNCSSLGLFVLLYFIGAYLRLYPISLMKSKKKQRNTFVISVNHFHGFKSFGIDFDFI